MKIIVIIIIVIIVLGILIRDHIVFIDDTEHKDEDEGEERRCYHTGDW